MITKYRVYTHDSEYCSHFIKSFDNEMDAATYTDALQVVDRLGHYWYEESDE